ncbi:hypothetical protein BDZ45DRAFT_763263 [Acephala macrosclerotiorum]|nr:hypothetical protein BDZ45DRAFT_763263 [Acephala macrosclerotiorum]
MVLLFYGHGFYRKYRAQDWAELLQEDSAFSHKESVFDWSREELREAILRVFSNRKYSYCLFIDGLDEVEHTEGQAELVRILDMFRCQAPNVKLCVSSRPEPTLHEFFKPYPKLRLQDLTKEDIRRYVTDVLGPFEKVLKSGKDESRISLIDEISSKADGVFLWARLVTKSLQTGITNADDWDTLMKRVNGLPRDIDQLYNLMWSRLNQDQEIQDVYRSEAAFYFQFILKALERRDSLPITLFDLMVASEKSLDDLVVDEEEIELVKLCRVIEKRVTVRCAGLLEVVWSSESGGIPWDKMLAVGESGQGTNLSKVRDLATKTTVTFIHRSAQQFLRETDAGKQMLSYSSKSDEECLSDLVRATMASALLSRSSPKPGTVDWGETASTSSHSELIMQLFVSIKEVLSEQMEFRLLDLYRKMVQSTGASAAFFYLTARFGRYAYTRNRVEQLESQYGRLPTETTTLLYSASSWFWRWTYHFGVGEDKIAPGKNELISWLLENDADPNLLVLGKDGEYETPFTSILKDYFIRIDWDSESTYFKDQIALGVQRFFDVAVDLRTTTLLYCYVQNRESSHQWDWGITCPNKPSWTIVVQVNCSWLTRAIIAKCEDHGRMNEKHLLALKCDDVEPEFKVLQIFFGDKHGESEWEEVVEYDTTNLVGLLQDRLKFPYCDWDKEGLGGKLSAIAQERFERSPGKVEESLEDWMIKKGFMAERRRVEEEKEWIVSLCSARDFPSIRDEGRGISPWDLQAKLGRPNSMDVTALSSM